MDLLRAFLELCLPAAGTSAVSFQTEILSERRDNLVKLDIKKVTLIKTEFVRLVLWMTQSKTQHPRN